MKSELEMTLNECTIQKKLLKKQTTYLSVLNTKILYLFKTLKLNKLYVFIKAHCVAEKLDDDVNEIINNENLFKILNLNILLNSLNSNFFTDFKLSS